VDSGYPQSPDSLKEVAFVDFIGELINFFGKAGW
jgi:hypothetical protein